MKAMILAAGRGERMRPLTDHIPKPLLTAAGKPLIEYHLERLKSAGYDDIVINLHHLGEQIRERLGDGSRFGLSIRYSVESPALLETGGGIHQALPLLGDGPFLVINGDIWTECDLTPPVLNDNLLAHLILVPNPPHHPDGDFGLEKGMIKSDGRTERFTFSGIGWYRAALFDNCEPGAFPLAPLLRNAAARNLISGTLCTQKWTDVGTPQRLAELSGWLQQRDGTVI